MYKEIWRFWFEEIDHSQWWAKDDHFDKSIIERFGRYPHRNNILGRESTAEKLEFLKQPGSGF